MCVGLGMPLFGWERALPIALLWDDFFDYSCRKCSLLVEDIAQGSVCEVVFFGGVGFV